MTFIDFDVLNYTLFEHEDHIEHRHYDGGTPDTEDSSEAVIVADVSSQGQTQTGADGGEAIQPGESPGPGARAGDVRQVGVDRKVEADRATRQVLETLKQQVLRLALK